MTESEQKQQRPSVPSLKEKTAKGLFWGGFSNIVQQAIGAGFGIAIARILTPDDFGLIGMLIIFTAIAQAIMDSGFTIALTNKKEIIHSDYNAVFWFSFIAGASLFVVLFFSAPLIAAYYEKPVLTNLSRLLFLSIIISSLGFAHNAILFKKLMIKQRAIIDLCAVLASGISGLVLALNGFAYWGLALQTVITAIISVSLRWYFAPWRPIFSNFDLTPVKEMFGFSSRLLATTIIAHIGNSVLPVLSGKYYGETITGNYTQGNKWTGLIQSIIANMIHLVAQPVFVEADSSERQLLIFRKMVRFGAFISFPVMLGFGFIGREFITITIGEKWIESVPVIHLLCLYAAFGYLTVLFYNITVAHGKSKFVMLMYSATTIALIISLFILKNYGLISMMIAYVLINMISIIGWQQYAHRLIRIKFLHLMKDIVPYLLITFVCLFLTWLITRNIQNIYLLCTLKIIIVAVLYCIIMYFSRSTIFMESKMYLKTIFK